MVSASFFETFRLGAVEGRLFDSRDRMDSLPVMMINQTMARELWPDGTAIGSRIKADQDPKERWHTIVGVVPDVVHDESGKVEPTGYSSRSQGPQRFMSIALRGEGDPRALIGAVRTALAETDPDLALYWVRTLDEMRPSRPRASHHRDDLCGVCGRGARARRRRSLRRACLPRGPAYA